jgi:hypothetical protein
MKGCDIRKYFVLFAALAPQGDTACKILGKNRSIYALNYIRFSSDKIEVDIDCVLVPCQKDQAEKIK